MNGVPSWASRGARIVCVLDFNTSRTVNDKGYRRLPVLSHTYAVRKAYIDGPSGLPVVTLREFEADHFFDLRGFRPAVEPRAEADDLAQFRHHLDQRQPERV